MSRTTDVYSGNEDSKDPASGKRSVAFARPVLSGREKEAVIRVLDSGWLTSGREAEAFEDEFAHAVGARNALAVSSATAALHLSLEAAGLSEGELVCVSPYTFAATAEVVRYFGAHPLFVDIEEHSANIDAELLGKALDHAQDAGKAVRAVIPVHMGGLPCDMERIRACAGRFGIEVIEDAAHAFPARLPDGTMVGSTGTACFSFYANKPITTGEGGMITTDSDEVAERVRRMRLHGIDRPVWDRFRRPGSSWEYDLVEAGFKYNLPDLLAAIGRIQLERSSEFHRARIECARDYDSLLSQVEEIELPARPVEEQDEGPDKESEGALSRHAWHLYSIGVPETLRDALISNLAERGVGTSVHYKPLHMMSYYRERYALAENDFPRASKRYRRSISLPIYPALHGGERRYVVESLKQAIVDCKRTGV